VVPGVVTPNNKRYPGISPKTLENPQWRQLSRLALVKVVRLQQ